ncbi:hypothetical protein BDW67DRAFT_161099 [Aspergillus spinulosporus]
MMPYTRPTRPYKSKGQIKSNSSSAVSKIFLDNRSNNNFNSNLEDSKESDNNNNEQDRASFNNKGELPPEHYLAGAENLDISQLQKKRYSNTMQEK